MSGLVCGSGDVAPRVGQSVTLETRRLATTSLAGASERLAMPLTSGARCRFVTAYRLTALPVVVLNDASSTRNELSLYAATSGTRMPGSVR